MLNSIRSGITKGHLYTKTMIIDKPKRFHIHPVMLVASPRIHGRYVVEADLGTFGGRQIPVGLYNTFHDAQNAADRHRWGGSAVNYTVRKID